MTAMRISRGTETVLNQIPMTTNIPQVQQQYHSNSNGVVNRPNIIQHQRIQVQQQAPPRTAPIPRSNDPKPPVHSLTVQVGISLQFCSRMIVIFGK